MLMPDEIKTCLRCHRPLDPFNTCDGCDVTFTPEQLNQPWPKAPEKPEPVTKKAGKKNGNA